jgi:hypothetical protein
MMNRIAVALCALFAATCTGCNKQPGSDNISSSTAPATASAQVTGPASLLLAAENLLKSTKNVVEVLNSVNDDASAREAAPKLRKAASELNSAARQNKSTIAFLETSGQHAEVVKTLQSYGQKADQPEYKIQEAIERVALGPQGRLLRAEIGAVLDAMMEGEGSGGRANLQKWIDRKKLRG